MDEKGELSSLTAAKKETISNLIRTGDQRTGTSKGENTKQRIQQLRLKLQR